ncbi:hypothetical protein QJQ45_017283, partial [Haematococcus lacustris]
PGRPWEAQPFPLAGPLYTYESWQLKCNAPHLAWMREYVAWHRETRHKPDTETSKRKYIGFVCMPKEGARLGEPVCSGLGDRIRGSLFLFRVAAMSRRLVIIKSEHPSPLKDYLKPSGIVDWLPYDITAPSTGLDMIASLESGEFVNVNHTLILCRCHVFQFKMLPTLRCAVALSHRAGQQTVSEDTLQPPPATSPMPCCFLLCSDYCLDSHHGCGKQPAAAPDHMYPGLPPIKDFWYDLHCVWHAMFQPSDQVVKRAEQHFNELRLTPQQPYTAIHLRLGGSMGEATALDRDKSLQLVLSSSLCAKRLAQQHGYEGPVVMVTDHAILRQFIAAGILQNVTVTKMIPHHFDQALDALDGLVDIVSDLVVLSHAKCQVMGLRGYSNMAHWWAGDICFKEVHTCVDELWKIGTVPRIMKSSDPGTDGSQLNPAWPVIHAASAAAPAAAQQLSQKPHVAACLAQLRSSWDEQVAAAAAGGRTTAAVPLCDSPSVLHDVTLFLTHLAR